MSQPALQLSRIRIANATYVSRFAGTPLESFKDRTGSSGALQASVPSADQGIADDCRPLRKDAVVSISGVGASADPIKPVQYQPASSAAPKTPPAKAGGDADGDPDGTKGGTVDVRA